MDGGADATGLTSAQVAARMADGKSNRATRSSRSTADIVRGNTLTLFNAIVGVLCVLILALGEPQDALFGLVIVANTGIGILQELRAKKTLDALAVIGEEPVRVIRDGKQAEIRPQAIVLGDRIMLDAGDQVPVDGEVTDSAGLQIDESLLTGESDPIAKNAGDRVLSGSFAAAGSGAFTATAVGGDAYAAQLVHEASTFSPAHSELRSGIDRFLRLITWLILPVAAVLATSQLAYAHGAVSDAVSGTVAGIVTMIPEGLVLLTSVALAVGVIRLGRRNCLVQELPAIEVLARVDVLCLDKTGTLTEGGMDLDEIVELTPGAQVREALAALIATEHRPNATLRAISAGMDGGAGADAGAGSGGDGGGDAAAGSGGRGADGSRRWNAVRVVPFSSARKWSGAVFEGAGEASGGWVLGAPDILLPAGDKARTAAQERSARGLRVLALGRVDATALDDPDLLGRQTADGQGGGLGGAAGAAGQGSEQASHRDVRPAGLLVLRQRVRKEAAEVLAYFESQGVAVKVISGDSHTSAGAIAAEVGVPGAENAVDARTLPGADSPAAPQASRAGEADDQASLDALASALERNTVFGRVTPRQKRSFVTALQRRGHTVAMTGDGVNDVLALAGADLGVAMGSGSGATRAVAKIVLLDNNFAALPHVVAEGRRVLSNIERVASLFLTKTMYSILLATATAVTSLAGLAGLHGLRFPFLPRHLTLISALTIGIPAFFLALAPAADRARPGFVPRVLRFAIPAGVACAAASFCGYVVARLNPASGLGADRTTATITMFGSAIWVLVLIARPYTWWRIALVAALVAAFAAVLAVPFARAFFGLNPQPANDLVGLAAAACASAGLTVGLAVTGRLPGHAASATARWDPPGR